MIILAIDTATTIGGVAVLDTESGALAEHRVNAVTRQFSESIIEMTDLCFRNMSLELKDVDCIAVTKGPGSFTGLRVGLSTVKGLAFAEQKPVVAVSTLLACAWQFPFQGRLVCPLLDARKKEVYSALYQWEGNDFTAVMEEGVYPIEDVLNGVDGEVLFTGDGIKAYKERIQSVLKERALFAPGHLMGGLASTVASLAWKKALNKEFNDPIALSPEYFRKSEAELGTKKKK